eukprot:gnl/Trimastix_PCT/595.p1 GENE.gnl/Trimastix_PCT/595~~gnl/Trimastix_PCT/595.p1  ORF type:complete len:494 (+),score=161.86 gnl/Trimastix_PCT/595:57-1484(+)
MSKQRQKKPIGDQPVVSFDVVKINSHGRRQNRQLCLAPDGIRNMNGNSIQWFLDSSDVFGISPDEGSSKSFTLTALHHYNFEAESPEQVQRIIEALRALNIGYTVRKANEASSSNATPPAPSSTSTSTSSDAGPQSSKISLRDFELLRVVGKGSFGKVLQVRKKTDQKIYAMKILKKRELYARNQIEHTNTERAILASLSHPFMVRLHYAFQNRHKLYLVLDYANGGEIFFHLRRAGRFPEVLATFYIAEVICTLDYLHKHDIIYRDLKPENIMLDPEGHIKITDFGLSKVGITSVGGMAGGQTTQTFCGTPEYLAPEILQGIGHGKAVDWWSVGILYYEMLTGLPPFYAQNRNEMYEKTIRGELSIPSYISAEAQSFLRSILMQRPEDRLGSGPTGGQEIKNHELFRHLDWEQLERRQIAPPFKPRLKDIMDISNIDPSFLFENPTDSPCEEDPEDAVLADQFQGFTFVRESEL